RPAQLGLRPAQLGLRPANDAVRRSVELMLAASGAADPARGAVDLTG
ncbi:hypothetical protein A2U01_0069668, partial [Trifolium medium]|nr:hypothetical protein [Trifolium medium]